MRTPDYNGTPLALEPREREGLTIHVESDGINEPSYMRVVEPNGREIIIPLKIMSSILAEGGLAVKAMQRAKIEAKILSNHPSHFADLDFSEGNNRELVLAGTSETIELTPKIVWFAPKDKKPGWKLILKGAEETSLMFAQWDDKVNIEKMAETIKDAKALFVMVALVNPDLASKLSSRSSAIDLKQSRAIPVMRLKEVNKIIEDAKLNSKDKVQWTRGGMGYLSIKINGAMIKVAVKIRTSRAPEFAKPHVIDKSLPHIEQRKKVAEYDKDVRDEWIKRFKEAIKDTGWRIVYQREQGKTSYYSGPSDLWITKIPEKEWSILEKAAKAEFETKDTLPVKF